MTAKDLDVFTLAYITAAMFTEDDDPQSGEFQMHGSWHLDNIDPASLQVMIAECQHFQNVHDSDIADDLEHAGRDFWYTRNGHGCGFWDGDWPDEVGKRLTDAAEGYGEQALYIGDDGVIYVYGDLTGIKTGEVSK